MLNPRSPIESCTLATCSLAEGQVEYQPSLGGNAFFVSIFCLAFLLQIFFGIRYRTWGFLAGMVCGLVLEIVGYTARLRMHYNPFMKGPFVMYLVTLTIGPTFFTASIYLCLARIIVLFGERLSRFKPRGYTVGFITSDITSLVLQAAGGAIASGAQTYLKKQNGIHIMVAGLAFQVASLIIFMILCLDFARSVRRYPEKEETMFLETRSSLRFKLFLWSLGFTTLFILIRSSFRVAELSEGFGSALANNEVTFMILEGGMVSSAVILLTVMHPGLGFSRNGWDQARWTLSGKPSIRSVPHEKVNQVATR